MWKYICIIFLYSILAGCSLQQSGGDDVVGDSHTVGDSGVIDVSTGTVGDDMVSPQQMLGQHAFGNMDDPLLDTLVLPEGFRISVYAEVPNARSLELVETNEQRVLFVGNRTGDDVYAVVDNNRDGAVDEYILLAAGLNAPNGVAYRAGDLYVAEINRILRFPNILERLDTPQYEVFFDDLPSDASHGRKYIAFGPDGNLYIPIGAPCNICDAGLPYAALHRLDIETKELSLVAEGIRNTVGFDRHPDTGELWFTDNGRDRMGDDLPLDELNNITQEGEHFGYPFCHQGDVQDPDFRSQDCDTFTAPFAKLGPHVAALGIVFHSGKGFPDERHERVFIAEHGSWNRSVATGYRITTVDIETGEYTSFIEGWLDNGRTHGRPVDIVEMDDGSLLISDDAAGRIYRVWYAGSRFIDDSFQEDGDNSIQMEIAPYSVADLIRTPLSGGGLTIEAVEASNLYYTRYRISYMSNGLRISGILNIPTGSGPFSVVILNHGYIDPAVYTVGRGLKREQDYLARHGYAVLHTDYRNHGLSDIDPLLVSKYLFRSYFYAIDSLNAIHALIAWDDDRIDASRVGMLGHSMGGGVTMHALVAQPDMIDAAVLYAPVHSDEYENMRRWRYDDMTIEERLEWSEQIGDIEDPSTFAIYSAESAFDRIEAPVQIYHGTNDESCPYLWSENIRDRMVASGVDVELITFEGEKHEFVSQWTQFMEGVVAFYDIHL